MHGHPEALQFPRFRLVVRLQDHLGGSTDEWLSSCYLSVLSIAAPVSEPFVVGMNYKQLGENQVLNKLPVYYFHLPRLRHNMSQLVLETPPIRIQLRNPSVA